jgi:hypothetical protein|tara:strand:+ start:266 stop:802 length:537 start_codon:yes stop_codon:yes gene_type:complete
MAVPPRMRKEMMSEQEMQDFNQSAPAPVGSGMGGGSVSDTDMMLFQRMVQNITPGDMSDEAETGLRMLLDRLKGGGSMTENEREMFGSVIGAMPQSAEATAEMNALNDNKDMSSQVFPQPAPNVPSMQGIYGPSSGVTVDSMSQVRPQLRPAGMGVRPQLRPAGMGVRPRMRPDNLGG